MDELEEQKLLKLIVEATTKVAEGRPNDETWPELWVAAEWLCRQDPDVIVDLSDAIFTAGPPVAVGWMAFLAHAMQVNRKEHESIIDGIPFDYDGETYRVVPVT